MKAKDFYNEIHSLYYEADCTSINTNEWDKLMEGATRANHKKINNLVKLFIPDLYNSLALDFYNPCNYYKTKTHLVLVHSSIEYFLKIN